jgi:hypothetical protein
MSAIASVAGGILATLFGVALGSLLTRRAQAEQWSRDRQLEACLSIIRESSRAEVMLRLFNRNEIEKLDWTPWNEALAVIALVGHRDMASAARLMDEVFWISHRSISRGKISNDEAWVAIRDKMEASRLEFINAARCHLLRTREPIPRLLARPLSFEDEAEESQPPCSPE